MCALQCNLEDMYRAKKSQFGLVEKFLCAYKHSKHTFVDQQMCYNSHANIDVMNILVDWHAKSPQARQLNDIFKQVCDAALKQLLEVMFAHRCIWQLELNMFDQSFKHIR